MSMEPTIPSKLFELKDRIDAMINDGKLDESQAEKVVKRWCMLVKGSTSARDPLSLEPNIAKLAAKVAQMEITPQLQMKKETLTNEVSSLMWKISIGVWSVLILTNLASMAGPTGYPLGWFADFRYLGFALAGVSINILLDFRVRMRRGDWDNKYIGIYVSRIVQVTVYAALIYWFVGFLPPEQRSTIPYAPAALLTGLFVHLIEEVLVGVGERFAEMISALFSTQFTGSRQKDALTQDMRKQLDGLRSKYAEADLSGLDETRKQHIKQLFDDALVFIHSSELDNAESRIQELVIELKNISSQNIAVPPISQIFSNTV